MRDCLPEIVATVIGVLFALCFFHWPTSILWSVGICYVGYEACQRQKQQAQARRARQTDDKIDT